MRYLRYPIILLLLFASVAKADSVESIIEALKKSEITSTTPMKDLLTSQGFKTEFDGDVQVVTLQNGMQAVFKSCPNDDLSDAHAEVAAFKAANFLGFPNIPPTIIRKIDNKYGSLQLYIPPHVDATRPGVYDNIVKKIPPEDLANLKLFYFVFGQWDSGHHNIIIQKENDTFKLIAIDNSGIRQRQFVKYGEFPFVRVCYSDKLETDDWHLPFPFEKVKIIPQPSFENLQKELGNKFPEVNLKKLSKNLDHSLYYVIYKNSLWVQFHQNNPKFTPSHTHIYPEKSIASLKRLDLKILKEIFAEAKGSDFLTPAFLNAILERRDQILKAYGEGVRS